MLFTSYVLLRSYLALCIILFADILIIEKKKTYHPFRTKSCEGPLIFRHNHRRPYRLPLYAHFLEVIYDNYELQQLKCVIFFLSFHEIMVRFFRLFVFPARQQHFTPDDVSAMVCSLNLTKQTDIILYW